MRNKKAVFNAFTESLSYKWWGVHFILMFMLLGFLVSVTQPFGDSPDYEQYVLFFDSLRISGTDALETSRFEPGFTMVVFLLIPFIGSNIVLYSIFVSAAMFLKGIVLCLSSSSRIIFFTTAFFYLARYFALHELTQVRAACAISSLLIASVFFWGGKRCYGLLACVSALLFHTSSAMIIPNLFFQTTNRLIIIVAGFLTFICVFITANFIFDYLGSSITAVAMYQEKGFGDLDINPFSAALLLDWAMIIIPLVTCWDRCSPLMKRIIFLEVIGMALFYGLIKYPVMAHRIREMYSVFWVFFVADGLRLKVVQIPTLGFVLASIAWYSYITFYRGFFS